MSELRALSAMALGGAPGPEVSILKIRGSEIQQRITELTMEAVGDYAAPYQPGMLFDDTNETPVGPDHAPPAAPRYFNMRKTTIYGGSNEIQKNIVSRRCSGYKSPSATRTDIRRKTRWICPFPTNRSSCRTAPSASFATSTRSRPAARSPPPRRAGCRRTGRSSPSSAGSACRSPKRMAATAAGRSRP